jgi:hypothetical protein
MVRTVGDPDTERDQRQQKRERPNRHKWDSVSDTDTMTELHQKRTDREPGRAGAIERQGDSEPALLPEIQGERGRERGGCRAGPAERHRHHGDKHFPRLLAAAEECGADAKQHDADSEQAAGAKPSEYCVHPREAERANQVIRGDGRRD